MRQSEEERKLPPKAEKELEGRRRQSCVLGPGDYTGCQTTTPPPHPTLAP